MTNKDRWDCPRCGKTNPGSRGQCYKRGCKGMSREYFRKSIAMMGVLGDE